MATGPEHYREAEKILGHLKGADDAIKAAVQVAQVHAVLALAAATALGREGEGRMQPAKDRAAWFSAAAECKKGESAA